MDSPRPRTPSDWRRWAPWASLAVLLVLAGALRFRTIETREPFISDEADYVLEAEWVFSLCRALWTSVLLYRQERSSGEDLWKKEEQISAIRQSLRGHAPYMARPGHVLLLAAAMGFLEDPTLAGAWVSASFGLASIPLLFLLARRLYGSQVALLACFLFVLSACHVWYSRTGFAEADTAFFVLLTVYLYVRSSETEKLSFFCLTGLSAGLGFLVHHRFILFLAALWVLEFFRYFQARSRSKRGGAFQAFLALNLCFCLPLVAVESLYHAGFIALQALGMAMPCPTYFTQLLLILAYIQVNNLIPYAHFFDASNFLTYPYLFWFFEGPLFCFLLAGGVLTLAARRRWPDLLVGLFLLGPLLFYSYQNAEARFVSGSLPFAMMTAALCVHSALVRAEKRGPSIAKAAWLVLAVLLAAQGAVSWSRIQAHSRLRADYRQAARFLESQGPSRVVCAYPHPFRLYLGTDHVVVPPASVQELRELYEQGARFAVIVEFLEYYMARFDIPELRDRFPAIRSLLASRDVMRQVYESSEPVFEAPCDFCGSLLNILEINLNFRKSLAFYGESRDNAYDSIKVYDLGKFFRPDGE